MVGAWFTLFTVNLKVVLAIALWLSRAVSVIKVFPDWFAVGVRTTVRLFAFPARAMPALETRPLLEEEALTVTFPPSSTSATVNAIGAVGVFLSVPWSSMLEMVGGSLTALTRT